MYLGLDLGTSSLKALLIDNNQRILGSASAPLTVERPHHGWSEQDPDSWIEATRIALAELGKTHAVELAKVRGIGLSGHMHGATTIDRDGKVIRPCILWNDTRSYKEAAELDADPIFRRLTGTIVFPGFTETQMDGRQRAGSLRPRRQGSAAEGLPAALAKRRGDFRDVGFSRNVLA